MTDLAAKQKLTPEQLMALNDELIATFLAMPEGDQDFTAATFSPRDIPIFLANKKDQMVRNQQMKARYEEIAARMSAAGAQVESSEKSGMLAGIAGVAGVGAAAAAASKLDDGQSRWYVDSPKQAINAAVRRLNSEFGGQEKTDFTYDRNGDLVHATVFVMRQTGRQQGARLPALDITIAPNESANAVEVHVGELDKQTLLDTAKALSKKGFDVLRKGVRVVTRRGRVNPGDMIDLAGDSLDTVFDIGKSVQEMGLVKKAWEYLGEVLDPLETVYNDLQKERREAKQKAIGVWENYINCPTCGVGFMAGDVQCRICDTDRPEKPVFKDPRNEIGR